MSLSKTFFFLSAAALALSCAAPPHPTMGCPGDPACVPPVGDGGMPSTGCSDDSQCAAPLSRCLTTESRCVACLVDSDCAAGVCDATNHVCALLPDSCSTAQLLTLSSTVFEVIGDTTRAADDTQLSCALPGTGGNDLVYTFVVTAQSRLTVSAVAQPGAR